MPPSFEIVTTMCLAAGTSGSLAQGFRMIYAMATAAVHAAPACGTRTMPRAIIVRGTMTEGGSTGPFTTTIDLRTGYSTTVRTTGVSTTMNGFNGEQWAFGNGIPTVVDVPTLIPIAAARAFVARLGWNDETVRPARVVHAGNSIEREYELPNTSRVTVRSRSELRRALSATVDADTGPETVTLGDWRCAAGVEYPFRQTDTNAVGESVVTQVNTVATASPTPQTFAVPARVMHGHTSPGGPAPFRYVGNRDHHMIVDAIVGTTKLPLIFDTGGANYFGPSAANAAGLTVSGGASISGVGQGSTTGGFTRIAQMSIANGVLENEVGIIAPLPWPETPSAPSGIAGFEFLAEFRTTMDFPNKTIEFFPFSAPLPSGGSTVPLRSQGHFPVAEALVNGKPGWFGVDTGDSNGVTLFKHFAEGVGVHPDSTLPVSVVGGAGGSNPLSQTRLSTFTIGGTTINNPRARLSTTTVGNFGSRGLAGNLGNGVIGCFRVTFDYLQRIMVLYPDASTNTCLAQLT